jgi:hypothetical protein
MNFGDIQNTALWRLRQRGVNFGGAPNNANTDAMPPYIIQALANQGYAQFLVETLEAQIVTLKLGFLTTSNATAFSLRPMPNTPTGAANPAVLRVWEGTYTTQVGGLNAGYEYEIELVSTQKFKSLSGDYTRRLSWFGPRVLYAARLYRRPQLDVLPGCATAGDLIQLTVTPDIANSPLCTCANGGPMVNLADVPLLPPEFHMAIVEYIVKEAGDAADKGGQVKRAQDSWAAYIAKALNEGGTEDGGYPITVIDHYVSPVVRE